MAQGFKKYFNSTTLSGRANVAKATYASIALLYLYYRVRRGRGGNADAALDAGQAAAPKCECCGREDMLEQSPVPSVEVVPPTQPTNPPPAADSDANKKKDCQICRDRGKQTETQQHTNGEQQQQQQQYLNESLRERNGEQPVQRKRRKCPCEDQHTVSDGNESSARQQPDGYNKQQPPEEECAEYTHPMPNEQSPAMHEAVYRTLRGLLGAVIGGANSDSGTGSGSDARNKPVSHEKAGMPYPKGGRRRQRQEAIFNSSQGNCECPDEDPCKSRATGSTARSSSSDGDHGSKDDDFYDGIGPDYFFEE